MKDKLNQFLSRKVYMEQAVTACMVSFLATIALAAVWLAVLAGGFGNLVETLKFAQVLSVADRVYIGEVDTKALSESAFDAVIDGLGDRWSYYLTKEEYDQYRQMQSNQYTGIGITMQKDDVGWKIISVAADSPAQRAGISADTYLVMVCGVDVREMESAEISALMHESADDFIVITETAEGVQESFSVTMERIYSNPVSYEMKEGEIGYIRMENFDDTCADQAIAAVEDLMAQGAVGLVFDVRSNGGGLVSEMCDLLDYLLPEGEIFVSVDRSGEEKVTKSDKEYVDLPMAVLVNENSYSAAECFAAVLREYDAAKVVGMQTTGKNRSQTNWLLMDGSAVHISSKQYLTPNRVDLTEQGGLTPDIVAEYGENDDQLAAALELFRENSQDFG